MALAAASRRAEPKGHAKPRVAPPTPARSLVADFTTTAKGLGIELFPWQRGAARYLTALGKGDRWLYGEVAVIVARQNGKTELLVPFIVARLRAGRRIMHTAQNRDLPREVFQRVADVMEREGAKIRTANGQEGIRMPGGGVYRIVAPTRGGARGPSNDDVIVDELREMDGFEFIAAAKPTLTASVNPQMLYLSNAGEEDSLVLNALRMRSEEDPSLAYLEWSAAPERASDDRVGWLEANPAVGHKPGVLAYLEKEFRSAQLEGTLSIFETEHLCRWVKTMREQLIDGSTWMGCQGPVDTNPVRPSLAVSVAPDGTRASVALAWRHGEDEIALRLLYNVHGSPIDMDRFGKDVTDTARSLGVVAVGFDPLTDAALARLFRKPKPEPVSGGKYANATAQFVNLATARKLRWTDADAVTDDLVWTSRKHDRESGSYEAVRASDNHSITAALASIRAVWLASAAQPAKPKVFTRTG